MNNKAIILKPGQRTLPRQYRKEPLVKAKSSWQPHNHNYALMDDWGMAIRAMAQAGTLPEGART